MQIMAPIQRRDPHPAFPQRTGRLQCIRVAQQFINPLSGYLAAKWSAPAEYIALTGGGTGIGRAMAERFLQLGAAVFICGRRAEVVQKTAAELSASTGGAIEGVPGPQSG